MNRSTIKAIGLLILLPAVALALLPTLAANTTVLNGIGDYHFTLANYLLLDISHDMDHNTVATASPILWALAGVAELVLMGVAVAMPRRTSRYRLNA